jgi:hypothetical protein
MTVTYYQALTERVNARHLAGCSVAKLLPWCQPGTLVHMVHCELYLHVTLSHSLLIMIVFIIARYSSLITTTFFSLHVHTVLLHPPWELVEKASQAYGVDGGVD